MPFHLKNREFKFLTFLGWEKAGVGGCTQKNPKLSTLATFALGTIVAYLILPLQRNGLLSFCILIQHSKIFPEDMRDLKNIYESDDSVSSLEGYMFSWFQWFSLFFFTSNKYKAH